jgi:hypothetical protein
MGSVVAERVVDHRKCAEECVTMAMNAQSDDDKALWLTLARSWLRLAEHVARAEAASGAESGHGDREARSPERAEDEEAADPANLDAIAPYWP